MVQAAETGIMAMLLLIPYSETLRKEITMNKFQQYIAKTLIGTAALIVSASPAWSQVALGTAAGFSVLGGTNVTCTSGVITGNVGVAPGGAVPYTNTGCVIAGLTPPATNVAAVRARTDFLNAYATMMQKASSCVQLPGNLADQNLAPGTYCLDAVAKAGTLTLTGPSTGEWIFLVNGALTGTNFNVVMAGGGLPCNVYWAPTAAATMTTSMFKGNILAGNAIGGSVTLTGGTFAGSVYSNVAVTMTDANVIGCDTLTGAPGVPGKPGCHGKGHHKHDKDKHKCYQGVGNGSEGCDPGKSNHGDDSNSNDEDDDSRGKYGRQGGYK